MIWGHMTTEKRQDYIIAGFIILSLLLHLLLLLVPKQTLFPVDITPKPVYVEVRPPQQRERELDLPIRKELEKPRETPAKRLAERDQVVEKEMAPEGSDTEDRPQTVQTPKPVRKPQPKPQTQPTEHTDAAAKKDEPTLPLPVTPEGWKDKPDRKPAPDVPDLKTLTQISPGTLAQIESDWRSKYRKDIDRGDTVWMDSQQDLLSSFMRRFRANIYNVWNYPANAIGQQQQGTCLLRITVDRQGNILDVELLESSGYKSLDEEAMSAVRQGATYGPLPRSYTNEDLKIMAFFQYRLGGRIEYSRRRPGEIF